MILIRTDWVHFDSYLASLSKPARKNYKAVSKMYDHLDYAEWTHGEFPKEDVRKWMRLWEQQLIRGKTVEWAFPVEHIASLAEKGEIKLFKAHLNGEDFAMHFIQKRDGYWECHPPMYDKKKHPSLAKWMWFQLIKKAIRERFVHLDMGGGSDDWVYNLKQRANYPNTTYKWIFVSERSKMFPDSEPKFFIGRPLCKLLLRN